MPGSDQLAISYTAAGGNLAEVVYRFPAFVDEAKVLEVEEMIGSKYGKATFARGNTDLGPVSCRWDFGPVQIFVERGWPDTTVYLSYLVKAQKDLLVDEQKTVEQDRKAGEYRDRDNAF